MKKLIVKFLFWVDLYLNHGFWDKILPDTDLGHLIWRKTSLEICYQVCRLANKWRTNIPMVK